MAEVQTTTESGEMTQRFIEFVMMQAQHAAFALGQIPHPQTGKGELHLDMAKLLIDQLVMIRAKTRGNLTNEELGILNNAISSLQMGYFEATKKATTEEAGTAASSGSAAPAEGDAEPMAEPPEGEAGGQKKFTKSYGA
jgi:hypothetical protein